MRNSGIFEVIMSVDDYDYVKRHNSIASLQSMGLDGKQGH